MKKVLLFLAIAMFMIVPMSFAKTAITEKDLGDVTAQEGVTINFDCFTVERFPLRCSHGVTLTVAQPAVASRPPVGLAPL